MRKILIVVVLTLAILLTSSLAIAKTNNYNSLQDKLISFNIDLLAQDNKTDKQDKQNLTEDQKKVIQAILSKTKEKVAPLAIELAKSVKQMQEVLLAEPPDKVKLKEYREKITELLGKLIELKINNTEEILEVLTPEQKKVVVTEALKQDGIKEIFEIIKTVFEIPEK